METSPDHYGSDARSGQFGWLQYLVRHRTAANLILLAMLVGGLVAGTKIRAQFFPDVIVENVTVSFAWPGAGPDDLDRSVIARMEPALRVVEGVESSTSTARETSATILLEFEAGWDMGRAMDEVKAAVDGVTDLPEGVEEPVIKRGAFHDRITDVVIYGEGGVNLLSRFAEEFQSRLFREGVTRSQLRGVPEPVIKVSVPEANLIRHDITLREIANAITAESTADPAGDIGEGFARVRTGVDRRSIEELHKVTVRSSADGARLYVRDIADIHNEGLESGVQYIHRGQPAVVVRVSRSARDDAIQLQSMVEGVAMEMQDSLPEGVTIRLTRTRSQAIKDRLGILLNNGMLGLALVLIFLFMFLSARTAFWVAMGIPAALAATIGIMYLFGFTLNMVSLFALIICLGIVVDDAIVVGEYADMLHQNGHSPTDAASRAVVRMAPPVFSASITTVIAFSALVFVGGRFGTLIIDIPFTVSMVLVASLAESFLVLPAHMRHALSATNRKPWYDLPSRTFNRGFRFFRERMFRPAFEVIIRLRYPVFGIAVMVLFLSIAAFYEGKVHWRFFNAPERGTISANISMLVGASREDTYAMLQEMQRALDETDSEYHDRYGNAPVAFALATLGGSTGRGLKGAQAKDRDLRGVLAIELIDPDLRPYSAFDFIADWQSKINRHPLLENLAVRGQRSGPGGDAIDIRLSGAETETLKQASLEIQRRLAEFPSVSALEDTLSFDKPEIQLTLKPKGEAFGFNSSQLGAQLRHRLRGIDAVEYPLGTQTAKIRVGLPESEITTSFLEETRIRAPGGGYLPLSEIVEVEQKLGFASIRREDGDRVILVNGDIAEDDPEAANNVTDALTHIILPEIEAQYGVRSTVGGLAEQESEFITESAKGFGLCLVGIYLTLCWIFASWTRPIVIMLIIPFGLVGLIWGHYLHNVPISMFSMVGFIGMSGIIINDSIVLITTIDQFHRNRALKSAVMEAVCQRLRAVILTTLTTVFGLAPLLFEQSRQAQFLKPTVITLVYGLGFGLLFVLMLTPALVLIQWDIGRSIKSFRRSLHVVFRVAPTRSSHRM
jgi:multidrug efflux pump subunit AcrB